MYTNNQEERQGKLYDIILTGGPPWGFSLTGGSEFGSRLCVNKVMNENTSCNLNQLQSGDEILSVNGVSCTSRANAIQMVRSIDDELRLKICRWKNVSNEADDVTNVHCFDNAYTNMVENMNDLPRSSYSTKRDLVQNLHSENNGNYRILSINKSSVSNEHNIRIGIPKEQQQRSYPPDSFQEQSFYEKPKMNASKTLPRGATSYSANSSRLVYPDHSDIVEAESIKTVSAAKAIFENLSVSSNTAQPNLSSRTTHIKNWNSGSAIDTNSSVEQLQKNNLQAPSGPPQHQHSKSLPIEMAGKEFEKAMAVYKEHRKAEKHSERNFERPKSAHYYSDETVEPPVVPQRYSQSELLKPRRNKEQLSSLPLDEQSSNSSLEELRDSSRLKNLHVGKNNPANELRQAANRYHQELMKNYPKFRHSIANVESTAKFSRKVSSPAQDIFSRGEPYRATIATTTSMRMPRSKSAIDTLESSLDLESSNVRELLSKSNENTMMSRLLRDQSPLKMEEKVSDNLPRKKSLTFICKSETVPENELEIDPYSFSTREAESYSNTTGNSLTEKTKQNFLRPQLTEAAAPAKPDLHDQNKVISEKRRGILSQHHSSSFESPEPWSHRDIIETDIDSEEAERIIHRKDSSTDSAVYMVHENSEIPTKALSMESNDIINEFSQIDDKSEEGTQLDDFDSSECLPPPPDELLQDEDHENVEKEKPQRTINRKKKDSQVVTSRNNSCVSTDSTTSTTTVDSGIVMRSSPRTSPLSSEHYYAGSRETLDGNVEELSDATYIPEHYEHKQVGYRLIRQESVDGLSHEEPSDERVNHTRQESDEVPTSRIDDLDGEKAKLMESMREKINELREQEQEISDEIKMNEELGKKVLNMVEAKATQSEFSKFELFIGELNKIIALLLSLTQRLHRYELMLQDLDMSNEADKVKKDTLVAKIDKLKSQHEEACYLRDVNDKRGDNVANFLEKYCTEEEFADFQYYVDMKSQLALMQSEIREKVKLGEERLKALQQTGSEWGLG